MAKFEKGHPKIGGIEKGGKHTKTKAWEALGEYLVNELADEYIEWLKTLKPDEKAKQFQIMIEYFKPKLQRSQVDQENRFAGGPLRIGYGADIGMPVINIYRDDDNSLNNG